MYSIDFQIDDGVLKAIVCGAIVSGEAAAAKAREVIDAGLKAGIYRILLDERELDVDVEFYEIVAIATELENRGITSRGGRLACLHRPEKKALYKTFETIYRNRSLSYQLFEDPELAMAWLKN